jgi:DNA-binding NtrC family response regulator
MEADGGTIFLDEIGDLPLDVQVKLLRAVQQGEIETVGARTAHKVNVRLISATNKDLIEEVKNGHFREDLYYRLNVFPITIPALRKRKEDIPHLVRVFTERFSSEQKNGNRMTVNAGALALLTAYDWPGNIRQLENAIFRAVVLADGPELTEADFPQIAAQLPEYDVVDHLALVADNSSNVRLGEIAAAEFGVSQTVADNVAARINDAPDNAISSTNPSGDVRKLADVEEELIRFALKFYRGQMSQVARKLGIGRSTLYRKLKDYGIDPDNPQKDAA